MAILERFPDLAVTANSSVRLQGDLRSLLSSLGSLQLDHPNSLLGALGAGFDELRTRLDVDPLTVTGGIGGALLSIQNALPANALAYAETLDDAYAGLADLLGGSEILRQVGEGQTLNAVAQAVIEEALGLFESHIDQLAGNLIGGERVEQVRQSLALIEKLQDDFAAQRAELLPFLAHQLLGVAPDLLDGALAHVQTVLHVFTPLGDAELLATLGAARRASMTAYAALLASVDAFDAADAAAYAQIGLHLGELEAANELLLGRVDALYTQLEALVGPGGWETVFAVYQDVLGAVHIPAVPTIDEVVGQLGSMMEELLSSLLSVLDADDLRARCEVLSQSLRDAVLGSPMATVKQTIAGSLAKIGEAVEAAPTEDVQRVVQEMLLKVQGAVAQVDIAGVEQQIEAIFGGVDAFVNTQLNGPVRQGVQTALNGLSGQLNGLPLANLLNDLNGALGQLQGLIGELEGALAPQLDGLRGLLAQAEALRFEPVSDAVVGEIDDLRARLAAIDPNALSGAERLALTGALAFLEAIDLQTQVIDGLQAGYHSAENEVRAILNQIAAALNQLRDKVIVFDPQTVLQPVQAVLEQATQLLEELNARTLLAPLYAQVDGLQGMLEELAPGRLLTPLQGPFEQSLGLLKRLDPAQLVAPLQDLYAQIDRLVSLLDVTPVLEELDRKQRDLLGKARAALLAGFDGLNLPAPLDGFLAEMRPIVELVSDALFGDPDGQLTQIGAAIGGQVRLGMLFAPLDAVFGRLVALAERVPAAELTTAMNALRQSMGVGLEALDPQALIAQLRAGLARLQEVGPASLLAQTLRLGALKSTFTLQAAAAPPQRSGDIAAVSVRFDAVLGVTTPGATGGHYVQLAARHAALVEGLRRRINALDATGASEQYAALRGELDRLLPDFLRQRSPLTQAEILAGLGRMRPSNKLPALEELFARFLQQLAPYESAVQPAVNGFFAALREIVLLLNPLALADSVASIYASLRQKARILDPAALEASINAILEPLQGAVQALSPAALAARLDASFHAVAATVGVTLKGLLDDLAGVLDGQLRSLRAALRAILDQLTAALQSALDALQGLLGQIEDLVFVEIIERLGSVIDNLGVSFDQELARVGNAFDEMLQAIPSGGDGGGIAL